MQVPTENHEIVGLVAADSEEFIAAHKDLPTRKLASYWVFGLDQRWRVGAGTSGAAFARLAQ